MQDRRINKLKDILARQRDEAAIIGHLGASNPRGSDLLGEVCRASILLHPSASFDQSLTLARSLAYILYIDDYLDDEHPELDLSHYREVCQHFLLWHNRDLSQMPLACATVAGKLEEHFIQDQVPEEWQAMRHLVWEKFIWTMLQENQWLKAKERVTIGAYLANGLYSIAFPIVQVSILAFSYENVSQELKNRLFWHICQASRAVRLANDLLSYERESAQGRFNAVDLIVSDTQRSTPAAARAAVVRLMKEEFDTLQNGVAREKRTGVTQQFLAHLVDSTAILLDYYQVTDPRQARLRPPDERASLRAS